MDKSNNNSQPNQESMNKKKDSDPLIRVSSKEQKSKKDKKSDEKAIIKVDDFNIPEVPEPPKKEIKLSQDSPGLSAQILKEIKNLENDINKVVLVNCERCKEVIAIPIPRDYIINSKIPVVPVSYVHKNPKGRDLHC
ncbi:MAG: hypothetical protein P8Y23_16180, partial [Candidatus Lokiarchaeota archaeon]